MKSTAVVTATAAQARPPAPERFDPGKLGPAGGTDIKVFPRPTPDGEREGVAPRFPGNTQVAAGLSPFGAVRVDPAAPNAPLRQKVGQLVPKGTVDLRFADTLQKRVERDQHPPGIRPPGSRSQTAAPFHQHFFGERAGVHAVQQGLRHLFEERISANFEGTASAGPLFQPCRRLLFGS